MPPTKWRKAIWVSRSQRRPTTNSAVLVHSFNQMTQQLLENRRAIEQASLKLQEANRQLEERGNTIEAILENIPTGVVSFDPQGQITRLNSTAERLFGRPRTQSARVLDRSFLRRRRAGTLPACSGGRRARGW